MRRIHLIPALGLLLSLGAGAAHAQYDNRATVITSPALGGGGRAPITPVSPGVSSESHSLPPGMAARLDDRVDQLEEMVRQMTGKLEEMQFKNTQLTKQIERMQADIDLRFKDLQASSSAPAAPAAAAAAGATAPAAGDRINLTPPKGADVAGPASGPQVLGSMPEKDMKKLMAGQSAGAAAPAPAKPLDAQGMYDAAYAAAQSGDYPTAEKGFQDFLAKNPNHQLAGNAQYWLGDIAYSKKDFGSAAATFLDAYKKFPKHTKAPDMIYKAGSSFGQLGKKKEACTAFTILFADHPQMPDRVKRAAVAEKQKYDCK